MSNAEVKIYLYGKQERIIRLESGATLGRGRAQNPQDIQVEHMVLSRRHGTFYLNGNTWYYQDDNSSNGSWMYGRKMEEPVALKDGDRIAFCMKGSTIPMVECEFCESMVREEPCEKMISTPATQVLYQPLPSEVIHHEISGNPLLIDIRKKVVRSEHRSKTLLKDIHLQIQPGEMTLILGGSGAGKTTFVQAVMGYEKADGSITYGQTDIYQDYEKMKYKIGFVPQKDLLRDSDSVFDTLYNAVQMKMPEEMNERDHLERVDEIMNLLGLEKQKETLVKKLSGGQRKRLSIAVEFAGNPEIFFLDEPDSGLDGVMARTLMEKLREIANMGKMVLVITHAPDRVAELFDKIIVLAKSQADDIGHLVFHGTIDEANLFFQTDSLEDILVRVNTESEGGEGRADEFIDKFALWRGAV